MDVTHHSSLIPETKRLIMTETEFIETIDCRFPYADETKWRSLIGTGTSISANAAFMVLHEICRPPRSCDVPVELRQQMLGEWATSFRHPLVATVLPVAKAMVCNQEISLEQSMQTMREIAAYPNQFWALSIAYFACDDPTGQVDVLHQKIIDGWGTASQ
jgi:hypothetical protein